MPKQRGLIKYKHGKQKKNLDAYYKMMEQALQEAERKKKINMIKEVLAQSGANMDTCRIRPNATGSITWTRPGKNGEDEGGLNLTPKVVRVKVNNVNPPVVLNKVLEGL